MSSTAPVLSEGAGWAVVVGLGLGFSVIMLLITAAQERYTGLSVSNQDEFSSASRSVKAGLISAGIVSAWTWSATLQVSTAVSYRFGLSGSLWYAAGATCQVLVFAMLAAKMKINAPNCSTYLQIIKARWGTLAHLMMLPMALGVNTLVGLMLVLGGSATVAQLTGLPVIASCFLTPLVVSAYTVLGGMRATLLADYSHSAVLLCIILVCAFSVWTPSLSDAIGSPGRMVELLQRAAELAPVQGNAQGSYLTFRSQDALIFGIVNICGNFATVFADQCYSQRAIASNPETATRAFILGGLAWTAIPLTMATSMGLAGRALVNQNPAMQVLTPEQVSAGLPLAAAAVAVLGKAGAAAILIMLYLAVTSAVSAQLIAVSSVVSFDVLPYLQRNPSKRTVSVVSHATIVLWALFLGAISSGFNYAGVGMGSIYLWVGLLVAPAVGFVYACLVWKRANRTGALVGLATGFLLGITAWLVTCKTLYGEFTVATLSMDYPVLAGNLVSILVPILIILASTWYAPDNYDWAATRAINAPAPEESAAATPEKAESIEGKEQDDAAQEKGTVSVHNYYHVLRSGLDPVQLDRSFRTAAWVSIPVSLILLIMVPAFGCIPAVWSTKGLAAWVGLCIGWLFVSVFIVVILPVWESRGALAQIFTGMYKDLTGGNGRVARTN